MSRRNESGSCQRCTDDEDEEFGVRCSSERPSSAAELSPQQNNGPVVVNRRLRVIEEELAAFKKDLSTMFRQKKHGDDKLTSMASYSGWYSQSANGKQTVGGAGSQNKFDQQVQTSPSDTPSNWPPPAVHGSPRRIQKPSSTSRDVPAPSMPSRSRSHTPKSDLIKWAKSRPGCRLAVARYSYKPLRDSPNNYPELELSLEPGDYLLLFGNLDEDYFYHGELFNGEQGLVPSNYVEFVDLDENLDSFSRSSRRDFSDRELLLSHLVTEQNGADSLKDNNFFIKSDLLARTPLPESVCPYSPIDASGVTVHEVRQTIGALVPNPREISVERQLTKSVLISWSPPQNALTPIAHYHVCIDGVVRAVVPAGYNTKALIENVDVNKINRISVRTVTEGGHSADAACSISIGKDFNVAAQDLKTSNVAPTSAIVSWYPSNSNLEHLVLLNGVKIGSCPPAVYQVHLKGLIPSTMYRCTIRVKDPKAILEEKPLETHTDFKTLPKIGLPEPPQNVQCELGPQDGTLLVTWQPVVNGFQPLSRYAVAGYQVLADGKVVKEVDSPTGDHAVLHWSTMSNDPPFYITVKTKSKDGSLSTDSETVRPPRPIFGCRSRTMDGLYVTTASNTLERESNKPLPSSTSCANVMSTQAFAPASAAAAVANAQQSANPVGANFLLMQPVNLQQQTGAQQQNYNQQQNYIPTMYNPNLIMPQQMGLGSGGGTMLANNSTMRYQTMGGGQAQNQYTLSLVPANRGCLDPSNAAYYVFHPHLTQMDASYVEKPSLLEMETNYLVRQQRQRRVSTFGGRRSYSLNDEDESSPSTGVAHTSHASIDRRRLLPARINVAGAFAGRGYSDDDWEYLRVQQATAPSAKPLISRHRRRLLRQVDSRALSEPDLRSDPRLMAALRAKLAPRYVVAMYDYDPSVMSPNPGAEQEELAFRKGQIILVFGDKDLDGFYRGELNGRSGLVPSNLVVESDHTMQRVVRRQDADPGQFVEVPSYSGYSPNRVAQGLPHPSDPYYQVPRKPFAATHLDRWGHNASDPSLARSRVPGYDSPPISAGSIERERYSISGGPGGGGVSLADQRSRRMKFKQKSHSLDYYETEDNPDELSGVYPRRRDVSSHDMRSHPQPFSDRGGYPKYDDYSSRERYRDSEPRSGRLYREGQSDYYGSLPRLHNRGRDEYIQDAGYETQRYPEEHVNFQRQARMPSRYNENPSGAYGYDAQYGAAASRKLPQPRDFEGRRRGSFRGGGRDALEQTINETVRGAPPRRLLARFDYDPKENSPNPGAELDELNFRAGDVIMVYGDMDEDGFFIGELDGRKGLVPSNYLSSGAEPSAVELKSQQSASHQEVAAESSQHTQPAKPRKDAGVSFSDLVLAAESKTPGPKVTVKAAVGNKPKVMKKADSTVSNKVPQKKNSTGQAVTAGVKKPAAAGGAKPAAGVASAKATKK